MLRGQKNLAVIPDEVGRASWPADGQAVPDHGRAKAQLWGDREREETAEPPCRSSVHLQVPLRISSSVFFLDKSLLISLEGLGGGGGGGGGVENRTSYRSTLSVRVGAAPRSRVPATASAEEKKDECSRSRSRSGRAPLRGLQGLEVEPSTPVRRVDGRSGDSEERRRCPLGSFSLPRPSPWHCEEQQEDAALLHTTPSRSESDGTDSGGWGERARSGKTEERKERDRSGEPQKFLIGSRLEPDASNTLSLKEALELFRPDFISRSQGRMRRLEQRAMKRRAQRDSRNPDPLRARKEERHKEQRNCTTPDPLSDNLFKPRERSISGREMQLRSRRKLPEVRKKKEAEKKRAISQTNRLRVEVFKKRLLDQILQR
ncbi:uncharacterized protein LOC142896613 isoform X2 [Nelusetta ayraudi]|uniref:uncharacterized protein LOC142896613 isoform X2 n=1 Tax=Nelusetta ayraudi TaxID=303726 RepID=UPI003F7167D2